MTDNVNEQADRIARLYGKPSEPEVVQENAELQQPTTEVVEDVEQLDELTGKGKLPAMATHYKRKMAFHADMSNAAARHVKLDDDKDDEDEDAKYAAMDHDDRAAGFRARKDRADALQNRASAGKHVRDAKDYLNTRKEQAAKARANTRSWKDMREDFEIGDVIELEEGLFEIVAIDGDNVQMTDESGQLTELSLGKLSQYKRDSREYEADTVRGMSKNNFNTSRFEKLRSRRKGQDRATRLIKNKMDEDVELFEIGDVVENEELNILGTVLDISEDEVLIGWTPDDETIEEEVIPLDELYGKGSVAKIRRYHHEKSREEADRAGRLDKTRGKLKNIATSSRVKSDDKWNEYNRRIERARDGSDRASSRSDFHKSQAERANAIFAKAKRKRTSMSEGLHEDSAALATLKAGSKTINDPASKLEVMKAVLGHLASMEQNDQVDFFNKMMASVGKEAMTVADTSAKNRASVAMKEDINALFEGTDVSDDFKDKTATLFEAAVIAKVTLFEAELEEQYQQALAEEIEDLEEAYAEQLDEEIAEIEEKVDAYLDAVAEQWLEENAVAIESTVRADMTESFIEGLRDLFTEHYIDIPEEEADVVEELAEKIDALEAMLDSTIVENKELREEIESIVANEIFEDVASDLTIPNQEKLAKLSEGIEFNGDADSFRAKLEMIREAHFKTEGGSPKRTTVTLNDEFTGQTLTEDVDPRVARYVQVLSNGNKQ